jgi:hypothetical protein
MLIAGQELSPAVQAVPEAQASCVLPPQGAQSCGPKVVGSGVKPALQVPPAHTACPLPPQICSHVAPSVLMRKPAAQAVGRQAPVVHDTAVLLLTRDVLQAIAQPPQLVAVLSASHPLRALESQLEKPARHTIEQVPAAHEGVPPVLEQAIPQPPQWLVAVCVLTQPAPADEQSTVGVGQVEVHDPPEQRVPAAQTVPQPPQWLLSVAVLTQTPLHDT